MENSVIVKKESSQLSVGTIAFRVAIYAVLILGAAILVFPYLWMLLTSFKDDYEAMNTLTLKMFPSGKWFVENYVKIWEIVPLILGVRNTLVVEVSVIVIGTFVSALAAFSLQN